MFSRSLVFALLLARPPSLPCISLHFPTLCSSSTITIVRLQIRTAKLPEMRMPISDWYVQSPPTIVEVLLRSSLPIEWSHSPTLTRSLKLPQLTRLSSLLSLSLSLSLASHSTALQIPA
ncbi:hypothetical protein CIRG_05577 [Coccidioides immitis RMSCC 2394]|uniref:Uncharacterized protein n=1 Tax=Coccidioides immitis RMSCC 2394 TaxID=404692 RepID=A0A0J6YAZ2_COCIT|nr:hypothetical protein CIRG_05577 [Coccidioides immitis RMSCC 2394]